MPSLLQRALRGEEVPRPPVWFMRQAGRYLPEYREIRQRVSFLELCHDSDLSLEVTVQPIDRFGLDAAIVFSDILVVLQAMGCEVTFEKGQGPRLPNPVRSAADINALVHPDDAKALRAAPETIRKFRTARPHTPIIGFAGSPFTLMCYLVEGAGSKTWEKTKRLLWSEPALASRLLSMLADAVGDHLQSQVDAGAAAVQLFDTWAGTLSVEDYKRFALPAAARALSRVKGAPTIYFSRDTSPFLHLIKGTGADGFSLDWRVEMATARRELGDCPVQGHLDPIFLFAPPQEIRRRVHQIMREAGPRGHIFNLGHGVVPSTPIEGVEAMVAAVKEGYSNI